MLRPLASRLHPRWLLELVFKHLNTHVPHNGLQLAWLRPLGMHAGPHTYIYGDCDIDVAAHIRLEGQVHIGWRCLLDGRGGLRIGENVVVGTRCLLITADHDHQDPFPGRTAPMVIENRVWVGCGATILKVSPSVRAASWPGEPSSPHRSTPGPWWRASRLDLSDSGTGIRPTK
ncbi:MAG: acyltransferase [Acidimicrobiales bacterium]